MSFYSFISSYGLYIVFSYFCFLIFLELFSIQKCLSKGTNLNDIFGSFKCIVNCPVYYRLYLQFLHTSLWARKNNDR